MVVFISFVYAILIAFAAIMSDIIFIRGKKNKTLVLPHFACFAMLTAIMVWLVSITKNQTGAFIGYSVFYISYTNVMLFLYWFSLRYCDRDVRFSRSYIAYMSLILEVLIVVNMFTKFAFDVEKRTWGGSEYWYIVGTIPKFNIYILIYVCWAIIIWAVVIQMIIKASEVPQLYRNRYLYVVFISIFHFCYQCLGQYFMFPAWLENILVIPFGAICIYLTLFYSNTVFKQMALLNVAQTLSDGLIIYDENNKMIYINDKLKDMLGVSQFNAFRERASFEKWASELEDFNGIKLKKMSNNGHDYFFNIVSHEFCTKKTYMGISYTLQDITETMERLEIVERANEELVRAGHMKSDFLANMSHEIRTPMNAVIGMAEMALREEMTDEARDYISQIKSSGRTLVNIINDILDFSKIESGKMEIIPVEYGLLSELHDVASTLMTRIGDKDIELTFEENPNIPSKLEGDILRIRQVLINLANNAIKFTNHGRVQVIMDYEQIKKDQINLIVHVVDTGIGIKDEDLHKLFNSFQQVDTKRNRNIEGTGLGLAISKNLVNAMGGSIAVKSEYGKGSDFYFSIPQKVIDPAPIIAIENASDKFAYGYFTKKYLARRFFIDSAKMGVFTHALFYPSNYAHDKELYEKHSEGKKRFLFFEEDDYTDEIKQILDNEPDLQGILLAKFTSSIKSDRTNLRILKKPLTTYSISLAFNEMELHSDSGEKDTYDANFTAPDANILVVDDNPINLTIAKGLLDPLKMNIDTAQSGKEALEILKKKSYDIVFMDHMMPQMDGVETTKVIRRNYPWLAGMPIVALTANAVSGVKDFFLSVGMNDFVPKPIDVSDITAKVKKWLPEEKIIKGGQAKKISNSENQTKSETENKPEPLTIEGLDVKTAVKMLGSESVYMTVLTEYYNTIDKNIETIKSLYDSEDWHEYAIKVHALKSSSRQIGAQELGEKAYALELAGKEEKADFIKENNDAMIQEYLDVKNRISYLFPESEEIEDNASKESISAEDLTALLNDLKAACDDLDMDRMEEISKQIGSYKLDEAGAEIYPQIEEAVSSIDVDTCIELADKWIEKL